MIGFFIGLVLILWAVWLEERSYYKAHEEVKNRRSMGDTLCKVEKTWYGWRVREYSECDL